MPDHQPPNILDDPVDDAILAVGALSLIASGVLVLVNTIRNTRWARPAAWLFLGLHHACWTALLHRNRQR